MSLLPFWALNVSVALLYMQGQKSLRFNQKYLNLCSGDEQRFWYNTRVSNYWHFFFLYTEIPFKPNSFLLANMMWISKTNLNPILGNILPSWKTDHPFRFPNNFSEHVNTVYWWIDRLIIWAISHEHCDSCADIQVHNWTAQLQMYDFFHTTAK